MLEKEQELTVKSYYAMKKGKPLPEYLYRWNDNSVVFCSVPIAATNFTLPLAKALRVSRITMYYPLFPHFCE